MHVLITWKSIQFQTYGQDLLVTSLNSVGCCKDKYAPDTELVEVKAICKIFKINSQYN